MRKLILLPLILISTSAIFLPSTLSAQGPIVKKNIKSDVSPTLREMSKFPHKRANEEHERVIPNYFDIFNTNPGNVLPDPAIQHTPERDNMAATAVAITPFVIEGLNNQNNSGGVTPPDPSGDVGLSTYLQVVNCSMFQSFRV